MSRQTHAVLVIVADDYGDQRRGPSFEFETFVPAFRRCFDRVTVFPQDRELLARGFFGSADALLELVRQTRPDLVFCVPFENQVDWRVMGAITAAGTPSIAWMCDDHWRWEPFSRHIAHEFSAVVTTDRNAFLKYHQLEGVRPILSQWGVDVARVRPVDRPRPHDVSFIGARRPHRERIVTALRRAGLEVIVRGSGWTEGRASSDEAVEIPGLSKVGLNFSDSTCHHAAGRTQLKARAFELAASGTCIVTEPDPQLAAFFDSSSEVAVANGARGFVRTIRWLLADREARTSRARTAQARTVTEHTYDVRLRKVLGSVGLNFATNDQVGDLCITK